jgi:hypothetical protein
MMIVNVDDKPNRRMRMMGLSSADVARDDAWAPKRSNRNTSQLANTDDHDDEDDEPDDEEAEKDDYDGVELVCTESVILIALVIASLIVVSIVSRHLQFTLFSRRRHHLHHRLCSVDKEARKHGGEEDAFDCFGRHVCSACLGPEVQPDALSVAMTQPFLASE